jgi:hypothetical protein
VNEHDVRRRVHDALGEPGAPAAIQRLEAGLNAAPAEAGWRAGPAHPHWMALVAGALALLLLGGLLTVRAAERQLAGPSSTGGSGSAGAHPSLAPPATAGVVPPTWMPSAAACQANAPARLIVVHLASQQLVAYQNGCPFLDTPVTTGGARLATPTGTYAVQVKSASMRLSSPWPPSDPNWYPDVTVHDYLGIDSTGLALHSAEWEPTSAFGPGSEYGSFASRRNVHVPSAPLQRLYDWALVGTRVIVDDR